MRKICCLVSTFALSGLALAATAEDWPQFRGPHGDGISAETGLTRSWGEEGPKELWRRPIGAGFSTIAVVGKRVYTLDSDAPDQENPREYALALNAETGEQIWRRPIGDLFKNDFGDGPRSGPAWHDGKLYALASLGQLHALNAEDGQILWTVDFPERYGSELPNWAFSSSPVVVPEAEIVVVETGGKEGRAVAAFDLKTGKQKWAAVDDVIAYSTPLLTEIAGVRQLVLVTQSGFWALDFDGNTLWQAEFAPKLNIKPAPAVHLDGDLFFASASYEAGAKTVKVRKTGQGFVAEDVVDIPHMRNHFNGSVRVRDHVVGFDKAILKCLHAESGKQAWATRGYGKGSLIRTDDLLIILSERGKLALAEATTEGFRKLAEHQVLNDRSWTQPTLSNQRLYVRNGQEIVALDLGTGGTS